MATEKIDMQREWRDLIVCVFFQAMMFTLLMEGVNNLLWHVHKFEMYFDFAVGSFGFIFFGYGAYLILKIMLLKEERLNAKSN